MKLPTSWKRFCTEIRRGRSPKHFGFATPIDDINRFAARFRVASSLELVRFDDFTKETSAGYTGLMKAALSYSTLEVYATLLEPDKQKLRHKRLSIFKQSKEQDLMQLAKRLSIDKGILKTVIQETNPAIREKLRGFDPACLESLYYLSEGIRHIFFHGLLTANSAGTKPKLIRDLGFAISARILQGIDEDFSTRV